MVYQEVLPVLQGWKSRQCLVQIEKHPHVYDGIITDVSEDSGKLELSTAQPGEGKKTLVFEFAGACFQPWPTELGEDWDEGFMVFPQAGGLLKLRKWKT
jgi:hypothetical protein